MSSPVLARLAGKDGDTVFTVRAGGILQEARLAHPAEAAFGAIVDRRRRKLEVLETIHGGAAERALLTPGDRIRSVDGEAVTTIPAFRAAVTRALERASPDAEPRIALVYERIDDRGEWVAREVDVPLTHDEGFDAVVSYDERSVSPRLWDEDRLGIEAVELSDTDETRIFGAPVDGVVLTSVAVGGAAYHAGLRPGDRLTDVDGRSVPTVSALTEALGNVAPGTAVTLRFAKGEHVYDRTVTARALDDRRYVDVPVVVHYTKGVEGSSFNVGYIVFSHETTYRQTERRAPSRDKTWSFLFGFLRWSERADERKLRVLWLIPISF